MEGPPDVTMASLLNTCMRKEKHRHDFQRKYTRSKSSATIRFCVMSDSPERLAPIELHRFLSYVTLCNMRPEYVGLCTRLAYLCLYARISYYGRPENGVRENLLYRALMVSKRQAKEFIACGEITELFVVDAGLVQLRPFYDFFSIVTPGRKAIATAVKQDVEARDKRRCVYCGATESLHYDHIYPVSKGGTDDPNNLVMACQGCNLSKSDNTLIEWMEKRNA